MGVAMRATRARTAENRARILGEASRQFRLRGFDGIGVAELMRGVGLTHGGFYGHFANKEELMALACRQAVADMLDDWRSRAEAASEHPLAAITDPYLSAAHRDRPDSGCLMAALGPEVARQSPQVRQAVTECLGDVLASLADRMPEADAGARRAAAIRTFASLVGGMVAARAVSDPALSDEILATVRAGLAADR
jgi:TetR/AcrR family transcriptional repressor of nem operon